MIKYIIIFILILCIYNIFYPSLMKYMYSDTDDFIIHLSEYINPIQKYTSLIGDKVYYNNNLLKESIILKKNWEIIRDEALNTFTPFPI